MNLQFIALSLFFLIKAVFTSISFDFIVQVNKTNIESLLSLEFLSTDKLCIGSPYQCLPFKFNPRTSLTFVIKCYINEVQTYESAFNSSLSTSFIEKTDVLYMYRNEDVLCGTQFKDQFKLGSIELNQFKCILGLDIQQGENASTIGLLPENTNNNYSPFLEQLYHNNIINAPVYSITFNTANANGTITFDKMDNGAKTFWKILRFPITKYEHEDQHISRVDQILLKNEQTVLEEAIDIYLDESFGFVQLPYYHLGKISKFLLNTKLLCNRFEFIQERRRSSRIVYTYFLCNKSSIGNMKGNVLIIKVNDGSLELKAEDMFIDYNENQALCTIILSKEEREQKWIIGYPLLKHYVIEHDFEQMVISLFSNSKPIGLFIKILSILSIALLSLMSVFFVCIQQYIDFIKLV